MTINCAFIGFGKSTTRYHLPYVLNRKENFHVAHIFRRHSRPELESHPRYQHIHFTSDLDDIFNDDSVKIVVICTHADSHFDYAKRALEAGKNVLVEKPFTTSVADARLLLDLAKSKGLVVTPYQNRRFDSCFLTTREVIESGKLGEIVEIESHFDYYRPEAETKPGLPEDGMFFGLGVHTMDQIISLFGRPDHVSYDIRSLRNKANPDDTFEAQLFYGDLKAIVKTSHYVKIDYPKFIVHGKKGSFIKYGIDQQETSLKAGVMPGEPDFAADESIGRLEYVNERGETVHEEIKPVPGDYGRVYDALYDTLVNGAPNYVRESDVLTNLEILERGFEQASPATVTLAK
ncbi:Putative oxidoreductase [Cronobacter condimenti 1330]|uniref:Oxidoreductase n=1 Tax=Cronobacter condimenti 1330 TaxID=1073999 RepID=K8AE10_9ENTR|nr:oxidoreductase [Cronobacter condimenti]ALB64428.1 oxidoreductase [Cronobacter condimenti 1330]CCJ72502.1 Putative oxidoreductase [Cronobacter condimenti 1330]